jgi:hypothetical protein
MRCNSATAFGILETDPSSVNEQSTSGERFRTALEAARAAEKARDEDGAIAAYLIALRILTPSDGEMEFAMTLVNSGLASGIVENAKTDLMDSAIRSELVSLYRSKRDFAEAQHHAEIALYLDRLVHGEEHNNTSAAWFALLAKPQRGLLDLES